jgi:hypothetical protein
MSSTYIRLIWKEVRAQRSFWLALLSGHIAISLLCLVLYGSELPRAVISFAVMAGSAFAIGSAALCFSNEEEERTALLVRMLPMSTRILASAKFSVTLLGTITLLLTCLAVSAIGSAVASLFWPHVESHWSGWESVLSLHYWPSPSTLWFWDLLAQFTVPR